jgi:hypothetical protein
VPRLPVRRCGCSLSIIACLAVCKPRVFEDALRSQ